MVVQITDYTASVPKSSQTDNKYGNDNEKGWSSDDSCKSPNDASHNDEDPNKDTNESVSIKLR